MKFRILMPLFAASLLAACGGGAGGYGGTVPSMPQPSTAPVTQPSPGAMSALVATILGSQGFTSPNGFTLYQFGADAANVSNCNGACAAIWPPFMAAANAQATGSFSIIARADGSKQWAYKTHPLYNFTGDSKPGDAHGDGLNLNGGIWHVSRP